LKKCYVFVIFLYLHFYDFISVFDWEIFDKFVDLILVICNIKL